MPPSRVAYGIAIVRIYGKTRSSYYLGVSKVMMREQTVEGVASAEIPFEAVHEVETTPQKPVVVRRKPVYAFVKRAFDLIISIICLTVGLPVYLIMILAIVINREGTRFKGFYIQKRIGLQGKEFNMVKLRTMYRDADKHKAELKNECVSDVHFKMKNDPRITRVGRFLRTTSLDETPQAVNVLLNHMSVVGPRAFVASEQSQLPTASEAGTYLLLADHGYNADELRGSAGARL